MKKALAIFLLVIYWTSSLGVTVHIHFCMNEIADISLDEAKENEKYCRYCGMDKAKMSRDNGKSASDCCKTKKLNLKIDRNHRSGFSSAAVLIIPVATGSSLTDHAYSINRQLSIFVPFYPKGPPGVNDNNLYITNRLLLI